MEVLDACGLRTTSATYVAKWTLTGWVFAAGRGWPPAAGLRQVIGSFAPYDSAMTNRLFGLCGLPTMWLDREKLGGTFLDMLDYANLGQ